jgi:transposase
MKQGKANRTSHKLQPLARKLYVENGMMQNEIAEYLGVSEVTVSTWSSKGNWKAERNRIKVTPSQLINNLYEQIEKIVETVKLSGQPMDAKTANNIKLISSTIREIDRKVDPVVIIDVFTGFINWLRPIDVNAAKSIIDFQRQYVQTIVNNE